MSNKVQIEIYEYIEIDNNESQFFFYSRADRNWPNIK